MLLKGIYYCKDITKKRQEIIATEIKAKQIINGLIHKLQILNLVHINKSSRSKHFTRPESFVLLTRKVKYTSMVDAKM